MNSVQELTPEQKKLTWETICERMQEDDKDPYDVIREDFDGDEEKYLRVMANWHGIIIEKEKDIGTIVQN